MSKRISYILIGLAGLILLAVLIYQIPYVKSVVSWRIEKFTIYAKNVINPPGPVPTALPVTPQTRHTNRRNNSHTNTRDGSHSIVTPTRNFRPTTCAGIHRIAAI